MNRRRRLLSLAFALVGVLSFALGVLVRDTAQDWRDQEQARKLAAAVRSCAHYMVVRADGTVECRPMMPRLDLIWPVPNKQTARALKRRDM